MQLERRPKIVVRAHAPTRVDLAGGTLDLWPIHHLLNQKATVNFGITLDGETLCSTSESFQILSHDQGISQSGSLKALIDQPKIPLVSLILSAFWSDDLPPISIETRAKSPAGAGIGGSSCLGITVASALSHMKSALTGEPLLAEKELISLVQDAESKLIKAPTGVQDYWGAMRGGLNVLLFPFGSTKVETLRNAMLAELNDSLVIVYSGQSRQSAINNWEIFKRLYDGDQTLLEKFQTIGRLAYQCAESIRHEKLLDALHFSKEEWELRKTLWPTIETPATQYIDQIAKANGGLFSRVCGAGGGGIVAVFAHREKRAQVLAALEKASAESSLKVLDAKAAHYGLEVTKSQS